MGPDFFIATTMLPFQIPGISKVSLQSPLSLRSLLGSSVGGDNMRTDAGDASSHGTDSASIDLVSAHAL